MDEVSHRKKTLNIYRNSLSTVCKSVCAHTWFGCHRLICALFESDSDQLGAQLLLTRGGCVFADDVELHCSRSLLARRSFDMTEVALPQGHHTFLKQTSKQKDASVTAEEFILRFLQWIVFV